MTEETQKKSDDKKSDGGGSRSNRRYYRQRGKKKGDQGGGSTEAEASTGGSGEAKGGQGEAKPASEGSGSSSSSSSASSSSRRRRSNRSNKGRNKTKGQNQNKERSSDSSSSSSNKRRSNSRKRRNRRPPAEPMVETGIVVPETVGYVEPDAVFVYEHLIRPAYRDASDYRPDSFSQQFDHSEPGASQLLGQYVGLYHPQYPMEEHPEDAPFRQEGAAPMLTPAEAIRAFFAENPEPEEEIPLEEIPEIYANPPVEPGPNADRDPDA